MLRDDNTGRDGERPARNVLGDRTLGRDIKASGLDLRYLVLRMLIDCADAAIGENAAHDSRGLQLDCTAAVRRACRR